MSKRGRIMADFLRNTLEVETDNANPLEDVFEEEPPSLSQFVQGKKFLSNPPLSTVQFEFVRHFEQILYPETYIQMVEHWGEEWAPVRYVNELAAEWGKGSGKDHTCQVCVCRVANILLCLKSPQEYYGMPHQAIIHTLNVAKSASQAHGVFFKPLRTLLTSSPWFADKFEGDLPGPASTAIRFQKQIELVSGHSSADTLEGKNLIAAIADEISAFPSSESKTGGGVSPATTAEGILDMLKSSAVTRFPQSFKLAQISYPRSKGDAIEQAVIKGKADMEEQGEKSRYFVSGPLATWDVNPRYDKIERIELAGARSLVPNVATFVDDYKKDPAFARAKYECLPEMAEARFFASDEQLFGAFGEVRGVDPVKFEYYYGLPDGPGEFYVSGEQYNVGPPKPSWQVRFHFAPDFVPIEGALYALHGDMAIKGDRAGVAMCHVRTWERKEWQHEYIGETADARPIVKVDFVTSFSADAAGQPVPREVQIRWYRQLIYALKSRGFAVLSASFDNFQSADTIQILEAQGIESKRVSIDLTTGPYETVRDVMYDGRLEGYYRESLMVELQTLSRMPNGKLDHPPGGSKDEADALAGAVVGAIALGGDEGETPARADLEGLDLFGSKSTAKTTSTSLDPLDIGWGSQMSMSHFGGGWQ